MSTEHSKTEGGDHSVSFMFNGSTVEVDVNSGELLADTVRDRLDCSSVRQACGIGICGSCTVMVDERAVSSCSMLTDSVAGQTIVTSEGLATDRDHLTPIQQAFVDNRAFQCSFCIPAFVLTIEALLLRDPTASVETIKSELDGNLCRCGSYPRIYAAIEQFVAERDA